MKVTNRPKSPKEIKAFVKRASASALYEWISHTYNAGYHQGAYDMALQKQVEKEKLNEQDEVQSTAEVSGEGEVSDS